MQREFGQFIKVNQQINGKNIPIIAPINETQKYIHLLNLCKQFVVKKSVLNSENLILFTTSIMNIVNQTITKRHCGSYKKQMVMSLLYQIANEYDFNDSHQEEFVYTTIHDVLPPVIDTFVLISLGKLAVKGHIDESVNSCLSYLFKSSQERLLNNEIHEIRSKTEHCSVDILENKLETENITSVIVDEPEHEIVADEVPSEDEVVTDEVPREDEVVTDEVEILSNSPEN